MALYLIKSMVCMVILFAFYKLLLEKESMHMYKRFYLLFAITAALIIPSLVFTEYVTVDSAESSMIQTTAYTDNDYIGMSTALENDVLDIAPVLWMVYFIGLFFFGYKFVRNLVQIINRIRQNPKQKSVPFIQVLLKENYPPHTFFKYIFLNKKKLESKKIPQEVLLHEETHARQKHSWDVVFIEFLQVILWFNPLVYLFKKAIKLNHEFLADQAVLNKQIDHATYQNTLLSYLSPDSEKKYRPALVNEINYSSIKKRFTVMRTKTSKKSIVLRSFVLLPLLALLFYGFSETNIIPIEQESSINSQVKIESYNPMVNSMIEENTIDVNDQEGATKAQLKEYDALALAYNRKLSKEKSIQIFKSDVDRLEYLYELMTPEQKENAEPYPDFPEPPPAPESPIVKVGETSDIPPPPPPVEIPLSDGNYSDELLKTYKKFNEESNLYGDAIMAYMNQKKGSISDLNSKYEKVMVLYEKFHGLAVEEKLMEPNPVKAPLVKIGEVSTIPPPPPPLAPVARKGEKSPVPPLPPKSPLDHVIEMAKKDAVFYHDGKKISSDDAIALLKKSTKINVRTKHDGHKTPIVELSTKPIIIKK